MPLMFGNMMCNNHKRIYSIICRGDIIEAFAYTGINSGFPAKLEVRAVHHWGVFAKLISNTTSYREDLQKEYAKKNWKVKWSNIRQYHLK